VIGRIFAAIALLFAAPVAAQQAVRVPVVEAGRTVELSAQLYRPATQGAPTPAVAVFHGCGGPGMNTARMAQLLAGWGYAALVVDSFGARGIRDACGRNWPSQAQAEARAHDIDASLAWLARQPGFDPQRLAYMGYSYGGGVAMLRAFASSDDREPAQAQASVLVYPDCALADALGAKLRLRLPTFAAMAELDDWTPVARCEAVFARLGAGRDRLQTAIYRGAHHSFDALGLPVRYLEGAGNRSKPGGCCGAHYGAHEPSWRQFVEDVRGFLADQLARKIR